MHATPITERQAVSVNTFGLSRPAATLVLILSLGWTAPSWATTQPDKQACHDMLRSIERASVGISKQSMLLARTVARINELERDMLPLERYVELSQQQVEQAPQKTVITTELQSLMHDYNQIIDNYQGVWQGYQTQVSNTNIAIRHYQQQCQTAAMNLTAATHTRAGHGAEHGD